MAGHLVRVGFEVEQASDAAGARLAYDASSFDVAVIDNELPDRKGESLAAELASRSPEIRIVLVVKPPYSLAFPEKFESLSIPVLLLNGPVPPATIGNAVERVLDDEDTPMNEPEPVSSDPAEERSSSSGASRSPDQQLVDVRRSYQAKIPGELDSLRKLVSRIRKDATDREALEEAHKIAHTLHGTAGTLGFMEVSSSAASIETQLKSLLANPLHTEAEWDEMLTALDKAESAPERPSLLMEAPAHSLGKMSDIGTVLIVDEDIQVLKAAEILGRGKLINVHTASNSVYAGVMAQELGSRLDGVIIDISMGDGNDAFDIARQLRSLEGLSSLPVAFMASDSSVANRVAAAHAGASQFLQKPLDAHELVETVRLFVASKRLTSTHVLVVDDDHHFRDHISALLESEGMEVTSLGEPDKIMDVIRNVNPDILLLDVMMPGVSGLDVCRMLRGAAAWKDLPILFLTAKSDPESRIECFRAGGDDYIEKPVIREELLARINVRRERIRLHQDRADRDALTGLPNRRAFLDMFAIRVAEGERYGRPVSLCVMDLDKFKSINDTYGHLSGDRVLLGIGKLLSARFRAVDVRGRWGGEEFVVAFYGEEPSTSRQIMTRVLDEFRMMEFEGDHGEMFQVTFSAGIAAIPTDGSTFEEAFRVADARLYEAKEKGRNRIQI